MSVQGRKGMPIRFTAKLYKTGSSAVVVIPQPIRDSLGIQVGDKLELTVTDDKIIITKAKAAKSV